MEKVILGETKGHRSFPLTRNFFFKPKTDRTSVNIHTKELWGFCNPFSPKTAIVGGPYKNADLPAKLTNWQN